MQKEVRIKSSPQGEQLNDLLTQVYPRHLASPPRDTILLRTLEEIMLQNPDD